MATDKAKSLLNEANRHMSTGKFSRASSVLKQLLAIQPKHKEGRRLLASLHLKIGNLLAAKPAYETLVKEALACEDYKAAESLLREYLLAGPRYMPFIELLAHTCEQQGDAIAAAIEYGKAIDLLLEDPDPDRPNKAAELYDKVKQIAPSSQTVSRLAPRFEAPAEPSPLSPPPQPAQSTIPAVAPAEEPVPPSSPPPPPPVEPTAPSPPPRAGFVAAPETEQSSAPAPPTPAPASSPPVQEPSPSLTTSPPPPRPKVSVSESTGASVGLQPPSSESSVPPPSQTAPPVSERTSEAVSPPPSPVPNVFGLRLQPAATESLPQAEEVGEESVAEQDVAESVGQSRTAEPPVQEEIEPEVRPQEAVGEPEVVQEEPPVAQEKEAEPAEDSFVVDEGQGAPSIDFAEQESEAVVTEERYALDRSSETGLAEEDLVEVPAPTTVKEKTRRKAPALPGLSRRRRGKTRAQRRISGTVFINRLIETGRAFGRWLGVGAILALVLPVLTLGGTVLTWLFTEENPNAPFSSLREAPPRTMVDYKRNGYFLLFGFGAGPLMDPVQAGYELWLGKETNPDLGCFDPRVASPADIRFQGDRNALSEWYSSPDPVAQFQFQAPTIRNWVAHNGLLLHRYRRWFTMAFEDWGFGHPGSPQCAQILPTHRLYVAEGFARGDIPKGLALLDVDLTAWRAVLTHAKTLPLKALATQAVRDDAAILSGLLARPGLDREVLPDLMRLAQGLNPEQRSLRWPIQHEFAREVKRNQTGRRKEEEGPRSLLVQMLQALPVPIQKIHNGHADYYQALIKAAEENKGALPTLYHFANTPPKTFFDYLVNPVDNILFVEAKPEWETYMADIQELDVRLRLAGLQSRLWTATDDKAVMARIAEAGSGFFDPFTGLPMLVSLPGRVLYSVGRNGKDDNGDPGLDITAPFLVRRFQP